MKLIKQLFIVLVLLCATQAFAEPEASEDYKILSPAQPTHSGNKIEVLEFFFYGCSHCFELHPLMSSLEKTLPKDVELTSVPVIFHASWGAMASTFYALEVLGQRERLHNNLYNAWNVENIVLADEASATDFVAKHGVDSKKFGDAYNSLSVQSQVEHAKQLGKTYGLRGTPTLIVDGKFLVTGLHPTETMLVLYGLIDKIRKERAGKH